MVRTSSAFSWLRRGNASELSPADATAQPDAAEIRAQLERIIGSPEFAGIQLTGSLC